MAKKKKQSSDEDEAKGGKGKMIIGGVVAVALIYQFVLAPKSAPADAEVAAGAEVEEVIEEGESVPVPELTLNLAGEQLHYLRVGVALILEKGVTPGEVEAELAKASDVVIDVLSAKTFDELRMPDAKATAKAELSEKVREAYGGEKVARVIFTSFVMQ